jgi:hypothetical protein
MFMEPEQPQEKVHQQCSCLTKKKRPCQFFADRLRNGVPYCHIHDPDGTFQQQQIDKLNQTSMFRYDETSARMTPPAKK